MSLLDMNMNMNTTFAEPVSAGRVVRPRFNSDVAARLVDTASFLVPPERPGTNKYPLYPENWDAELHAAMYLDGFLDLVMNKYSNTWRNEYATVARSAGTPPNEMTRADLNIQVLGILDLALERELRFAEVLDQDDSVGCLSYWLGMLKIDPVRTPATDLMVRIGRRIGEHISMCLKGDFRSPRPPQVCPAITPMFDPPITPSFPAGHAVQAYLISYLLADAMPALPQHTIPAHLGSTEAQWLAATGVLFDLAARVSENRVVAGVHYPVDIASGKAVAARTFIDLRDVPEMAAVRTRVMNDEFPQYN